MTNYSGPARLTLVDGTHVSGMASLSTNQRGGVTGWGGTFRPDVNNGEFRDSTGEFRDTTGEIRNAGEGLSLELPYDQIGSVSVTGVRRLLATQILVSLAGSGPAPF